MDYSDVYAGAQERQAHIKKVSQTPRIKASIPGAKPKKLTLERTGSEFNQFNTKDIEGATPKRKTFMMGSMAESQAAGKRPTQPISKGAMTTRQSYDASKSFIFGDTSGAAKVTPRKTLHKHAQSNSMAGIFGGASYADYEPKSRASICNSKMQAGSKTYASSGVANILGNQS